MSFQKFKDTIDGLDKSQVESAKLNPDEMEQAQLALLVGIAETSKRITGPGVLMVATNGEHAMLEFRNLTELMADNFPKEGMELVMGTPSTDLVIFMEGQLSVKNKKDLQEEALDYQSRLLKLKGMNT